MSKKYEQLIEYIINDEEDKAKELFHDIVVETSRDIYENLIDEEDYAEEETIEDMSDAIEADEEGISEEDDEMDMEMPMDMGDEEGNEEESEEAEEEELEDRVMDLEDALDELKAEFDQLMDGDKEEPEMESAESTEEPVAEEAVEEVDEAKDEEVEESEDDESAEVVKEYVDKVAQPSNNSEAHKSPVAGKNDMGGKAVDPTGEEKGGSMPKVAPGKEYKNTAGGKAPMEKAPAPKTSGE
jgi:hypothetical protein